MAGYAGYSKSNNAVAAEKEGRFPLTAATNMLAEETGMKRADAKALLLKLHTGEYHHSSKFYNRVQYYDVAEAAAHYRLSVFAASLPEGWRQAVDAPRRGVEGDQRTLAQRSADIAASDAAYAAELGVDTEMLVNAYYEIGYSA